MREIVTSLSRVSKRWRRISDSNCLWTFLHLDEWNIQYITEEHLKSIMSHSPGFIHFSLRYIEIVEVNVKSMAILHKSLACSSKLEYLDLSGQPITSIRFLLRQGPVLPIRTLILNDCTKIRTNDIVAVIMQLQKLETLSLNRVGISAREAVAIACSQPSLFMLGLVGIKFSLSDVRYILEHNGPFFLEMSRFSIDEPILRSLESEFDTSIVLL